MLDVPQHLQAVHLRQFQVQQDYFWAIPEAAAAVGASPEQKVQRLSAVPNHMDLVQDVVCLERANGHHLGIEIVLNQQNFDRLAAHERHTPALNRMSAL